MLKLSHMILYFFRKLIIFCSLNITETLKILKKEREYIINYDIINNVNYNEKSWFNIFSIKLIDVLISELLFCC